MIKSLKIFPYKTTAALLGDIDLVFSGNGNRPWVWRVSNMVACGSRGVYFDQ
jgi:hypothetical protein